MARRVYALWGQYTPKKPVLGPYNHFPTHSGHFWKKSFFDHFTLVYAPYRPLIEGPILLRWSSGPCTATGPPRPNMGSMGPIYTQKTRFRPKQTLPNPFRALWKKLFFRPFYHPFPLCFQCIVHCLVRGGPIFSGQKHFVSMKLAYLSTRVSITDPVASRDYTNALRVVPGRSLSFPGTLQRVTAFGKSAKKRFDFRKLWAQQSWSP